MIFSKPRTLLSLLTHQKNNFKKPFPLFTNNNAYQHHQQQQQKRFLTKVRLKWVKNRTIDSIIDKETDLKAAMLLKDAIKRSPTSYITEKTVSNWQKPLGLTVPVLRFLRRYPTLFHEFPHPRYASLPCFDLTHVGLSLDCMEREVFEKDMDGVACRLGKLLMMCKSKCLPLSWIYPLKWDMGFPDRFEKRVVEEFPGRFRVVEGRKFGGIGVVPCLELVKWEDEVAVSVLHRRSEEMGVGDVFRRFKKGQAPVGFDMSFPRGYGGQKKVKAWMDEFDKLPYISPYEDCSNIDPESDLMEKRVVGVLHEFLSLTIHKKTKRNYLRCLREELSLPHKFTRIFTRYPGIFYLSLKCKTTTITLKEGYRRGKLVDPHPLARVRDKFHYVMRQGLLHRGKGVKLLSPEDYLIDGGENVEGEDGSDAEESEVEEECWEEGAAGLSEESDG